LLGRAPAVHARRPGDLRLLWRTAVLACVVIACVVIACVVIACVVIACVVIWPIWPAFVIAIGWPGRSASVIIVIESACFFVCKRPASSASEWQ